MKRAIAWMLCLVLLCGCGAAPAETPTEPSEDPEISGSVSTETPAAEEPELDKVPEEESPSETAEPAEDDTETSAEDPDSQSPSEAQSTTPAVPSQPEPSGQTATAQEPEPASPAAPSEPPTPPEDAAPGPWESENGLYYVQEDGTCLVSGTVGYLTFGEDGRYTSGDADLDAGIDNLIAQVCPDLSVDSESRLRLLYDHIRDNYRYLSMEHYETGSTHWGNSAALIMLNQGKGNCYNFTALFTACARRLGYQAYNVAGHEWSATNDHAWTMIDWPDGVTYLFDVQLEWAYLYQYANKPKIDMFKASGGNGSYNGFAYYFP